MLDEYLEGLDKSTAILDIFKFIWVVDYVLVEELW